MRIKTQICLIIAAGLLLFSGCQPSYSTEMSISLQPAATDKASAEQSKPVNALDTLVVVEKIVAANNLKRYTPDTTETFLLDLADTDDLMEDGNSTMTNTTHYKHPDLPVYLSVTPKPERYPGISQPYPR